MGGRGGGVRRFLTVIAFEKQVGQLENETVHAKVSFVFQLSVRSHSKARKDQIV